MSFVLAFSRDTEMAKRFALAIIIVILFLGIGLIGLDILDIDDGYLIHLPTAMLNTVFISVVSLFVACVAAMIFTLNGAPGVLGLGCAALAVGIGSLLKEWLAGANLNVLITVYDSTLLIASIVHLAGAGFAVTQNGLVKPELKHKQRIVVSCYVGIILGIALVTLLAFRGAVTPFVVPGRTSVLRDIIQVVTATFFAASSLIYLRFYYKSHEVYYYWYSLGLMLFALGIFFISQGSVESPIAWVGRAAMYVGGIYFIVSVSGTFRLLITGKTK
jgi:hypothetical protein